MNAPFLDSYLITQIGQQDEQALALLYDRYSAIIYAIALRITYDRAASETVVLDVFSTVWQSACSLPTDTSVPLWLIRMTRQSVQQIISFDKTNAEF